MKVVIDTNVLISGIFYGGIPGKIVDLWLDEKFLVCATNSVLREYFSVYDRISQKNPVPEKTDWHSVLPEICYMIDEPKEKTSHSRDAKDNIFVDCALASNADCLISGDKDLIVLQSSLALEIVTPRQFLNLI